MQVTIKQIADHTGISKSTVSRVISGNGYVSEKTRSAVLEAIQQLHYRPNAVARAMVSRVTRNLGVIMYRQQLPIASHPVYGKILDAILETAMNLGYSVFVSTDKEISASAADFLLEKRVDGLVLVSRLTRELIDHVKGFSIPFVMVNGTSDDSVVHLVNDDRNGGMMAAQHLVSLGMKRFFVIAGPQEHRSHSLRLEGFRANLAAHEIALDEREIYYSSTSQFEEGEAGIQAMCERALVPDAVFATNDMMALGAMKAVTRYGLDVPKDIAVMGFDNIDYAALSTPSLTTIHSAKAQMGREAVFVLDQMIQGETDHSKMIQFSPKLIIRDSAK